jgi:hypothetical protein
VGARSGIVERVRREADAGAVLNDGTAAERLRQPAKRARRNARGSTRAHGDVSFAPSGSDVEIALLQG